MRHGKNRQAVSDELIRRAHQLVSQARRKIEDSRRLIEASRPRKGADDLTRTNAWRPSSRPCS